ncbi:histidinol-phosphate transaminase [Altericista sp. CCNU0014]|uniref:histidinol-phosphate transaminase n=1 Tax=Altericista sp. CCNU0014 TaxID=3082949 RepID=UPI0038503D67
MLPFLRSDLAQLNAYTPHPEAEGEPNLAVDRLDTNECPYDLPVELKQKLAWTYQHQIEANRYPDGEHDALKRAIAAYVTESATDSVQIDPRQISVGNGSDELIRSLLIATCLGGQGSILVAEPTFSMYAILAQTLGIPVARIRRTEAFALDLREAEAAVSSSTSTPVRVVFVVHPNSPTGNPLTRTEIDWLKQLPPNILVAIDEAYFEFSQQTLVAEIAHRSNWVILRTFSKAFRLAAHRVGYAIAQPTLIQVLEKVRLPYNLPAMSQAAAQLALTHRAQLLQSIPELMRERDRMYAALSQLPRLQLRPSAANFIYAWLETEAETENLRHQLRQLGTSIRFTGGGLRITIGTPAENDRTLQRISSQLQSV